MVKGIYVIGDVHGCYKTLLTLISKLPKDSNICFVGDLIDRGKDSSQVVEFVRKNNYDLVLGNHEDMMVTEYKESLKRIQEEFLFKTDWMKNGGIETINSYTYEDAISDIEFFKRTPIIKEYDITDSYGRKLVVSHSQCLTFNKNSKDFYDNVLWNRIEPTKFNILNKGFFNIFGHTPVSSVEINLDVGFANIDTGCVYKRKLTAIHFPSMEIIQQENIEDKI